MRETKAYQIRLPKELWVKFYRAFPRQGERKILLERFIEIVVADKAKGRRDPFIEGVLREARELYRGELEDI